jgi:hypothetical protein
LLGFRLPYGFPVCTSAEFRVSFPKSLHGRLWLDDIVPRVFDIMLRARESLVCRLPFELAWGKICCGNSSIVRTVQRSPCPSSRSHTTRTCRLFPFGSALLKPSLTITVIAVNVTIFDFSCSECRALSQEALRDGTHACRTFHPAS